MMRKTGVFNSSTAHFAHERARTLVAQVACPEKKGSFVRSRLGVILLAVNGALDRPHNDTAESPLAATVVSGVTYLFFLFSDFSRSLPCVVQSKCTLRTRPDQMEETRRGEEGEEKRIADAAAPPPAKKPKANPWSFTASLIRDLEGSAPVTKKPSSHSIVARLTSSSCVSINGVNVGGAGMIQPLMTSAVAAASTSTASTSTATKTPAPVPEPASAAVAAAATTTASASDGRLKLTFKMGGAQAASPSPSALEGEEDVFVDYVDGVPGDAALKVFGLRKQLCVKPAAAVVADAAAAAAKGKEEEEEEVFAIDGEIPSYRDNVVKPRRQKTPEPPPGRTFPPRNNDEVAGGEDYFMAHWRYFLEWNLKLDPAAIIKKLDFNQNRSGKPFDIYGLYAAVMRRGGYQDEVRAGALRATEYEASRLRKRNQSTPAVESGRVVSKIEAIK